MMAEMRHEGKGRGRLLSWPPSLRILQQQSQRTIEVDPVDAPMVTRLFESYATGAHTLTTVRKLLKQDYRKTMSRGPST